MNAILERLERGERWWAAEIVLRSIGLGLLHACALMLRRIFWLVHQPRPHQGAPLEFAVAAIAFACLSAGLALLLEGPGLFRRVDLPPRPLIH